MDAADSPSDGRPRLAIPKAGRAGAMVFHSVKWMWLLI